MAQFTIESETRHTVSRISDLFDFISDFKNFPSILPSDKVEDFQYSGDECSFNIKGVAPMKVKIVEKKKYDHVLFSSEGLSRFNFSLKVNFIGHHSDAAGSCRVELMGDLNPIIRSMAEKPLTTLVNTMSQRLAELKVEKINS